MSSLARRLRRSQPGRRASVASLIAVFVIGLFAVAPVAAAPAVPGPGYVDFVYKPDADGTGGDDVTSFRNQSKLWFNDGRWWAIMFEKGTTKDGTYRIQSFNNTSQTWSTGVTALEVDKRNWSNADALWDGTSLWVVSSHDHGRNWAPNGDLRLYKFSYNATTKKYSPVDLDGSSANNFKVLTTNGPDPDPVNKIVPASGTIAATIAKAPDGSLWVTYTKQITPTAPKPAPANVFVIHGNAAGTTWGAPFVVPGMGTPPTTDDMAAITTVGTAVGHRGIGVLWSNQVAGEEAFYFAAHTDGAADGTWGARETAFGSPGSHSADGHISVKTDANGRVIAAVKTNRSTGTDPLIDVLARTGDSDAAGAWTNRIVSSVNQHGTRPMLVLDSEASQANVFITDTTLGSGHYLITRRTADLTTLDFGAASIGTPFISSTANGTLNNATSTKQITSAASGVIVLAAAIATRTYLHACAGSICPIAPTAVFSGTPLTGEGPLNVQFTDASTGTPATWAWTFGDGGTSTLQNPSHTFNPGTWSVSLTVTNLQGTNTLTKTGYVTASIPAAATYTAMDPVRVMDSRFGTGGISGKFVNGTPRSFQVANTNGIPPNAVAITGNLTVTTQSKSGFLFIGPTATSTPTSSTLNFPVGDTRANAVTVGLSGTGQLAVVYKSSTAGATTNAFLDVTGYFTQDSTHKKYTALAPVRVMDSRFGTGGISTKFVNGTPKTFLVGGTNGIPGTATAITGNLTVTGQSKSGFVFLGPTATGSPTSSTLNFPVGDTRANAVTVALDGTGHLSAVYKSSTPGAKTNLFLDVTGYFDSTGNRYIPLSPVRVMDSRDGTGGISGKFVNGTPRNFDVAETGATVPGTAVAITGQPDRDHPVQVGLRLPWPNGGPEPELVDPQLPGWGYAGQRGHRRAERHRRARSGLPELDVGRHHEPVPRRHGVLHPVTVIIWSATGRRGPPPGARTAPFRFARPIRGPRRPTPSHTIRRT